MMGAKDASAVQFTESTVTLEPYDEAWICGKIVSRRRLIRLASWLLMGMLAAVLCVVIVGCVNWECSVVEKVVVPASEFEWHSALFLAGNLILPVPMAIALVWGIVRIYDKLVEYQIQVFQKTIEAKTKYLEKVHDLNKEKLSFAAKVHKEESPNEPETKQEYSISIIKSSPIRKGTSK